MKTTPLIFLSVFLLIGCSKNIPPAASQPTVDRPIFDIQPTDVVSVVVKPSNQPDHVAELEMQLTEDCVTRYEPFGRTNHGRIIEVLANGKPLLEEAVAPDHWGTNFTAFIYTSMEDATNLADSLKPRQAFAKGEDVTLTINGVTNEITLGKESVITLPDGPTLKVLAASKPYALYSDKRCSFEYISKHSPEISKDDDGYTTITFMSSSGANVIIHERRSMRNEELVDGLLKKITKKDIANGYSSVERKIVRRVSGGTFSGKEITTAYHKKEMIHRVLECHGKDDSILINVFYSREDTAHAEEFLDHFWGTMKIKAEANPQGVANGRQPFSRDTNSTSAAAAFRRSP